MSYQAISSCRGRIQKLLVKYNGSEASLEFIEDVLQSFPEDTEILIWINDDSYLLGMERLTVRLGRRNCQVIPQANQWTLETLVNFAPPLISVSGSVWARDDHYISKNRDHWGIIHYGERSIPVILKNVGIIHEELQLDRVLPFGNILIDQTFLFYDRSDVWGNEEEKFKEFLRTNLFPKATSIDQIVGLGYQQIGIEHNLLAPLNSGLDITSFFKHIDLMCTPTGVDNQGAPVILVARVVSPHPEYEREVSAANGLMDTIANQLNDAGIIVLRNPVPFLRLAPKEHWVGYYNNAIVESTDEHRHVWLPGFRAGALLTPYLECIEQKNAAVWESLGFEVHFISGGIFELSREGNRGGALRCLTVDFR